MNAPREDAPAGDAPPSNALTGAAPPDALPAEAAPPGDALTGAAPREDAPPEAAPSFMLRLRFGVWALLAAMVVYGHVVWWWYLTEAGITNHSRTLIIGQIALVVCLGGIGALLATTPARAIKLSRMGGVCIVLLFTFYGLRNYVLAGTPVLSDHIARERYDGRQWLAGMSPYVLSPGEWESKVPARKLDAIDRLAPDRWRASVAPPVAQGLYALGAKVSREAPRGAVAPGPHWAESHSPAPVSRREAWIAALRLPAVRAALAPIRGLSALGAFIATVLLLILLWRLNASPWWAVLFAWNPLLAIETAANGRMEIFGVALLIGALLAARRERYKIAAILLALAGGVRIFALLLFPFLWRDAHERDRARRPAGHSGRKMMLTLAVALGVVFIPALLFQQGHMGFGRVEASPTDVQSINGPAAGPLPWLIATFIAHRPAAVARAQPLSAPYISALLHFIAVLAAIGAAWQTRASLSRAAYWIFLAMLLTAARASGGEALWPLAMVPLLGGRAGWAALTWSATACIGYVARAPGASQTTCMIGEYGPVLCALALEIALGLRASALPSTLPAPQSA